MYKLICQKPAPFPSSVSKYDKQPKMKRDTLVCQILQSPEQTQALHLLILDFYQALRPYQRVHRGYLNGYLLHRTCVFKALCLFFLPNFPGPTFISTSIPDTIVDVQGEINVQVGKFLENIKCAGRNRHAGGAFSGKSINVQGGNFLAN